MATPSMDVSRRRWLLPVLSALLVLCVVPDANAQAGTSLTVLGGASPYDLSGTGTSWVIGGAAGYRPTGHLGIEAGLRLFRYEAQSSENISYLFPEVGVQVGVSIDRFRPYVGAGAGAALAIEGGAEDDPTLHGALGVDVGVDPSWSLRPEVRFRSVDPWAGSMGDFTLGVTYRP